MQQPHEVLGVRARASKGELARAFRRFALQNHPDRGGDPARFQAGVEAYHRLTGAPPPGGASRPPANVVSHTPANVVSHTPANVVFHTPANVVFHPPANVVFHRRRRAGVDSLLRLARRRMSRSRL